MSGEQRSTSGFAIVGDPQQLLAAIVDSADDAIVSKTLDGVIQYWNRGAERIFGWTAAEAVGRHIMLIIPDERRAEEDDIIARIRRGEPVDHLETVRLAKDGRRLNISVTVSRSGRGCTDRGASKVARDVTDRRCSKTSAIISQQSSTRLMTRCQQDPRRRHPILESRRRAHVRVDGGGSGGPSIT